MTQRKTLIILYDLMNEAGIDKDDIDFYIANIDWKFNYTDIHIAFKNFIESDRSMKSERDYLYPVFVNMSNKHKKVAVKNAVPTYVVIEKSYKPKPEKEMPRIVSADQLVAEVVGKMNRGENVKCALCGEFIKHDQIRGWWLSIYPAHLTCIHAEFNRRAAAAGRRIPFPDEEGGIL